VRLIPRALTLIEIVVAGGLILVVGTAMLLGVLDAQRRADDALRVSYVRQVQAGIEAYRSRTASYPSESTDLAGTDAALAQAFAYLADPPGCAADGGTACRSYSLQFTLKGPVGLLTGGNCTAGPQGLLCPH
jgi:type II secretory pathway pseudopilin PulG